MKVLGERKEQYKTLRPVSTSANSVARTGTIACSSIEKKKSDWLSLILVAIKLKLWRRTFDYLQGYVSKGTTKADDNISRHEVTRLVQ